jgi:hypothetical protein
MAHVVEIKDLSRQYRTYNNIDGGGDDHWLEEYAVEINGVEKLRTWSRIEAEDFACLNALGEDRWTNRKQC